MPDPAIRSAPPPLDAWDPPESRLEAHSFALFAVRRALMQSLVGLSTAEAWRAEGDEPSVGEIVRGAWERELHLLWPAEAPPPALPPRPSVVELLYGLVRHRGRTEEILMAATEADLERAHPSRAGRAGAVATLGQGLRRLARAEFADLERLAARRARREPAWPGVADLRDRAARALAQAEGLKA